jgi:hypothetical protein
VLPQAEGRALDGMHAIMHYFSNPHDASHDYHGADRRVRVYTIIENDFYRIAMFRIQHWQLDSNALQVAVIMWPA